LWPRVFTVGDFFLPTYGLLVVAGFLAGLQITMRQARRLGLNPELVSNLAVYCALAGMAGAKLMMIALDLDTFLSSPSRLFSLDTLLSAGVFHGGFLAALLVAWFYARRQKLPWLTLADCLAPGVALGHAIGRLGCFAAGCCWGAHCDRPWAVTFTSSDAHAITGVPLGVALHPTQLYESAGTFVVFLLLLWRSSRTHRTGLILAWYLIFYSLVRLVTESFREHQEALPFGGPFTWTQWLAVGLAGAGLGLIGWSKTRASVPSAGKA
jgi:phosphatidylglycerol---prolipoprotein diacylglyceryl transferase